jgi:hypothetical protein
MYRLAARALEGTQGMRAVIMSRWRRPQGKPKIGVTKILPARAATTRRAWARGDSTYSFQKYGLIGRMRLRIALHQRAICKTSTSYTRRSLGSTELGERAANLLAGLVNRTAIDGMPLDRNPARGASS